jgi:hypothetical protein
MLGFSFSRSSAHLHSCSQPVYVEKKGRRKSCYIASFDLQKLFIFLIEHKTQYWDGGFQNEYEKSVGWLMKRDPKAKLIGSASW